NPALVMVRISAFGQTGPRREQPGFGRIAAAVGGLSYVSGYPDRPPVTPGTPTVTDYLAGVFAAVGALAALRHAERTGHGQVVDDRDRVHADAASDHRIRAALAHSDTRAHGAEAREPA